MLAAAAMPGKPAFYLEEMAIFSMEIVWRMDRKGSLWEEIFEATDKTLEGNLLKTIRRPK